MIIESQERLCKVGLHHFIVVGIIIISGLNLTHLILIVILLLRIIGEESGK